jgi:double-strand break repair protein MRE11
MPAESVLAAMAIDDVKVEKLVHEFLTAQSLKILPQAPFGDAVTQFVDKGDKYAMEIFVNESLSAQVKDMLAIAVDDEDIDSVMDTLRQKQEALFATGALKLTKKKGKLKPRPDHWDSDMDGEWEDQPGAFEFVEGEEDENAPTPAKKGSRGKVATLADSEDNASVVSAAAKKATAKKAPAKSRAPAKPRAPAKAKGFFSFFYV